MRLKLRRLSSVSVIFGKDVRQKINKNVSVIAKNHYSWEHYTRVFNSDNKNRLALSVPLRFFVVLKPMYLFVSLFRDPQGIIGL